MDNKLMLSSHTLIALPENPAALNAQHLDRGFGELGYADGRSEEFQRAHGYWRHNSGARLVPYEAHPNEPAIRTEADIYRWMGLPYVPPHLRNC